MRQLKIHEAALAQWQSMPLVRVRSSVQNRQVADFFILIFFFAKLKRMLNIKIKLNK
jgi:hypothetical protein